MDTPQITHAIKMFEKRTAFLNGVIAVATPIAIIIGGFFWYKQNLWQPSVEIKNVNYEDGTAVVTINGKDQPLFAGSTLSAKYGWGVRFAGKQSDTWDRIELVKDDLTKKTLSTK